VSHHGFKIGIELALQSPQQVLAQGLAVINLEKITRESGWQKRRGKKLRVGDWIKALMACGWQSDGRPGQWAWQLGLLKGQRISVQGLHRRVNLEAIEMIKRLWGGAFESGSGEALAQAFA
jgi:hypothetical protein